VVRTSTLSGAPRRPVLVWRTFAAVAFASWPHDELHSTPTGVVRPFTFSAARSAYE
jgi:hypothetical protein